MRGVRGTAAGAHAIGDAFVLIQANALQAIVLPPWAEGHQVTATCGTKTAQVTLARKPIPAAISDPSGGTTADTEARAAIAQILTAMRTEGLIAS